MLGGSVVTTYCITVMSQEKGMDQQKSHQFCILSIRPVFIDELIWFNLTYLVIISILARKTN